MQRREFITAAVGMAAAVASASQAFAQDYPLFGATPRPASAYDSVQDTTCQIKS
jgi:hypothetical protein